MLGLNQDIPLLLPSVLEFGAATFGKSEIVSHGIGEAVRTDYARTAARARRLASSLQRMGYGPDRFAGSLAWNSHRHLELFYGLPGTGAVLHTANPRLPPDQIAYTVNFTGYDTLFVDLETVPQAEQLLPRLETVRRFVIMAPRELMPATTLPEVLCYEDLIDAGDEDFAWPVLDERTACLLCFTSGTTGVPKGALYTHRGTVLNAMSTGSGNAWALSANDSVIAVPGFFHCNGWAIPFFGPMYGSKLVIPGRRMDTGWLHALITQEGVTAGTGVPTIWLSMLDHCRQNDVRLGRLDRVICGGTAPPMAMMEAYMRDYGVRFINAWGMTETTSGGTYSFASRDLRGEALFAAMRTQGRPQYGAELRIADDSGAILPKDGATRGNLQVRGHWIAGGYFRQPEIDSQTPDGWLRTGDVATIDPDNTMHIVDRAKDVIKSGGEWISSQALEDAAAHHPAVQEAAVLAVPHPKWQERPLLIVVSQTPVSPEELRAHLAERVPKWWLPESIVFVEELPHGPTGKLAKNVLRDWLAEGRLTP